MKYKGKQPLDDKNSNDSDISFIFNIYYILYFFFIKNRIILLVYYLIKSFYIITFVIIIKIITNVII